MNPVRVTSLPLRDFRAWPQALQRRAPLSFDIELTTRCQNNCRHCYNNRPASDAAARARELTRDEVLGIARQAAALGAVWCLLSGGEPLLREDFADVYLGLKQLGLLVSVNTNAALVTPELVALFQRHPPRDIEVTVYGITRETYERVTRRAGSFDAFERGLRLLLDGGVKVRLKAMALRSTLGEIADIAAFCRARTKDYFRFDPLLTLRTDGDAARNAEILAERLSAEEIIALERGDAERFNALQRACAAPPLPASARFGGATPLLDCSAGVASFSVAADGMFRLCASLCAPGTMCDLRRVTLREAWETFAPSVRARPAISAALVDGCRRCALAHLCQNCPANAFLETGELEAVVPHFCALAKARNENAK